MTNKVGLKKKCRESDVLHHSRELCHWILATKWQEDNICISLFRKSRVFLSKLFKMTVQEGVSKQAILKAISAMPEKIPVDALIDEIMYLYKIEIGLAQSREGQIIPLEEVKQKVKTWGKEK